jgi:hypothetical protein
MGTIVKKDENPNEKKGCQKDNEKLLRGIPSLICKRI